MIRKHLQGALVVAALSLSATSAVAQTPQGKSHAADKADKADKKDGKGEAKAEKKDVKAEAKADKKEDKEADKQKAAEERAARRTEQHAAQMAKLKAMLKASPDDALKQELRRHAERLARLERIKTVAQTEKDGDSVEKASKLMVKENERHEKWLGKRMTTTVAESKGGAK